MPESAKSISKIGTDSPTTNDLLGFKRFAKPIALIIANATNKDKGKNKSTPLAIGVYGEWGSGKTSFLKMIDEFLGEEDIHPIWFNAWKYDQEDNLWSALIQTILDQTRVSGKWYRRIWVKLKIWRDTFDLRSGSWEIAKWLLSVGLRISIVGLGLLLIFGWSSSEISTFLNQVFSRWLSANPLTLSFLQTSVVKTVVAIITFFVTKPDEWLKLFDAKLGIDFSKLKRSKSYRSHIAFLDEFSKEFKRIIKLAGDGKPLVVIIDDLDRCLPEKAIQVLEAIKLFLDVEGCIFLLAVDRDVVERAIAAKYKDLLTVVQDAQSRPERLFPLLGENYFEKIIQLPFTLPPIADKQFKDFVTNVYPDEHIHQCADVFFEGLPRNPRKVKRLLQTFLLLQTLAGEGLKNDTMRPSLIAKIVIIQSQFRSVYQDLVRFHTLLAELEQYYRGQANKIFDSDESLYAIADPILREKIEVITTQFPLLRKVLLQKVDEKDTFVGVDIEPYLSLTAPTIETKPEGEVPSRDTIESLNQQYSQYLRLVVYNTQSVNLQSINASVVSSAKPNIENLFIATPLTILGNNEKRLEPFEILKRTARAVVLGPPGSGKTMFLNYLANVFARSWLQNDTALVKSRLGISENLLPLLVPLREYELFVQKHGAQSVTPESFTVFLDDYYQQWNIRMPLGFFARPLERGNCILLLDGLDEVSQVESERQLLVRSVANLSKRYPTVRIIVTSRAAGYSLGLGENFAQYIIADFDDSAIKELVKKWSLLLTEDQITAKSQSDSLLSAILDRNDLHALAKNPLLLTTMVTLHFSRGVLPNHRVDLYEDSLDILLFKWDAARGIRRIDQKLQLSEIKSLLGALAFSTQDTAPEKLDGAFVLSVFSSELTKDGRLSKSAAQNLSNSLLETITERTGILIQVAPNTYQFAHLTFQEYLAAIALTESNEYIKLVTERCSNVMWQESIVLSVARVARASSRTAEDVIQALLETQCKEGILLAGRGLAEIMSIENTQLRENVIKSLNALIADNQVVDSSREQAKVILDGLEQIQ